MKVKNSSGKKINVDEAIELKKILSIIFESDESGNYVSYDNRNDSKLVSIIKKILRQKKKNNEKIIELKREKSYSIVSLSDSEKSNEDDCQFNKNELKSIIKSELKERDIITLLKELIKKVDNNQGGKKLNEEDTIEINGKLFFSLWKARFTEENYKKKEQYIHHNNKENISTLEDMELTLCKLLEGERIDLFLDDPKDIDKIIKRKKY